MSELKATTVYDAYWKANSTGEGTGILVYLKSEADKVIAEKDRELRHQKYKRCLAMAKICEDKLGTVVKPGWWNKWHKRWLGLSDKFKEAK